MNEQAETIPWTDWGGEGPVIHLAHANGFPPGAYAKLVRPLLPRFNIVSMGARPLWPGGKPRALRDWDQLGEDLRAFLRARGLEGIVGVGHSVGGAATLVASALDPGLFRGIVLLDPTILGGARGVFWSLAKALGQVSRVYVVRDALGRRDRWGTLDEVRESWASKKVFARLDPECLDDYVRAGTTAHPEGGLTLSYPKEWEARIFATTPAFFWKWVRRLEVPALVMRGARSDTFLKGIAAKVGRLAHSARVIEVEGGTHLFPLERPGFVAQAIAGFIDSLPPA